MDGEFVKKLIGANFHDFKNYLSTILLYTEFLSETLKDVEQKEDVEIILKKCEEFNRHIESFRFFYYDKKLAEEIKLSSFLNAIYRIVHPLFKEEAKSLLIYYENDHIIDNIKISFYEILHEFYKTLNRIEKGLLVLVEKENQNFVLSLYSLKEELKEKSLLGGVKEIDKNVLKEIKRIEKPLEVMEF